MAMRDIRASADSHIVEVDADMMSVVAGQTAAPRNPAIEAGERPGDSRAAGVARPGSARHEEDAAVAQGWSGR